MTKRLLFDLSTLVRWYGPPVGIVRAQQQLARYARSNRPDVIFTIFDPMANQIRAVKPEWIDAVIDTAISIDPQLSPDPGSDEQRFLRGQPRFVSGGYFWLTNFRRKLISELERRRLAAGDGGVEAGWRSRLVKKAERRRYYNDDGSPRPCPPLDMIATDLRLGRDDVFIGAQIDWTDVDIRVITKQRRRAGFRHVVLCYDIISLLFPEWYDAAAVDRIAAYYDKAFRQVDRVIFTASAIEEDTCAYFRRSGIELDDTLIVPLGADPPLAAGRSTELPPGVESERFALFVSTIEPRKNHRLLVDVWRRLTAEGVVDEERFKLVFLGRHGWKMSEFFAELAGEPEFGRSILHLSAASDRELAALYRNAAFCLYPSIYEGFGLPVVEAMMHGKPVIASNGGALREVAGEHCISLDPKDETGWHREMRRMIKEPDYRQSWAARLEGYRPVSWEEAGRRFFKAVDRPFGALDLPRYAGPEASSSSSRS